MSLPRGSSQGCHLSNMMAMVPLTLKVSRALLVFGVGWELRLQGRVLNRWSRAARKSAASSKVILEPCVLYLVRSSHTQLICRGCPTEDFPKGGYFLRYYSIGDCSMAGYFIGGSPKGDCSIRSCST